MFTRAAHGLLVVATSLLVLGLGTANPFLVGLSAIPFSAVLLGLTESLPRVEDAEIDAPADARAGDVVEATVRVRIRGDGLLAVEVPLPDPFALAEGTNVRLIETDGAESEHAFTVRVHAARRGRHELGPVRAAPVPVRGLRSCEAASVGESSGIEVRPGLVPLRRLRRMRGTATRLGAGEDEARLGLETTDFREIREYRAGDPPKTVNWKATARLGPAAEAPLVNEYEVEGRRSVWLVLDGGRHMAVGTTVENGFEVAVAAASGLSLAYLDRGYSVGLHAYNVGGGEPIYPEVGDKQFFKIQRRLARLSPGEADEGPLGAVSASEPWLRQRAPTVVLLTRTDVATDELEEALRRLQATTGGARAPVVLVEPLVYHLLDDDPVSRRTTRLLDASARARHDRLRRVGARVVPWNPREEPLERLLFRGVLARG